MRAPCSVVAAILLAAANSGVAAGEGNAPARLATLQPTVVAYRWTFLVPEWVVDARTIDARIQAPRWTTRRIAYGSLEFTTERRRIGRMPEFDCKYADFALPNACRTTWRDVYVDVYVPVVRRDSFDVDVPQWSAQDIRTTVDVPRLVWKTQTLVVSLPASAVSLSPPHRRMQ